jgi:hypothetical protein
MSDDLPSTGGNIEKEAQIKEKNANITILIFLIMLSGCFFYIQNWGNAKNYSKIALAKEKSLETRMNSADEIKKSFQDYREGKNIVSFVSARDVQKLLPSVFEVELVNMVEGYPIEAMIPTISEYDRNVAAMVVGIAKKESDWGKHSPSLKGTDCFNYWGYKGGGSLGWAMGYGCFASPEEGAKIISEKIEEMIGKKNISRPAEMLSWKCGASCASHNPESVNKWVSDVSSYFFRVLKLPG